MAQTSLGDIIAQAKKVNLKIRAALGTASPFPAPSSVLPATASAGETTEDRQLRNALAAPFAPPSNSTVPPELLVQATQLQQQLCMILAAPAPFPTPSSVPSATGGW